MTRRAELFPLDYHDRLTAWSIDHVVLRDSGAVGLLALRHALTYRLPGVWVDDPWSPRSLLLVREGEGQLEAFGWGRPTPAGRWLARRGLPTALLAPPSWGRVVARVVKAGDTTTVATWAPVGSPGSPSSPTIVTRRLTLDDAQGFARSAPSWALRGWVTFEALIVFGAAFGVPHRDGFASLAWVFDQSACHDAVGVFTPARFRRLGLARASASALVQHVRRDRNKLPLWSTTPDNAPSHALARSLGFAPKTTETILRWPPRSEVAGATVMEEIIHR